MSEHKVRFPARRARSAVLVALLLVAAACGGGDDGGTAADPTRPTGSDPGGAPSDLDELIAAAQEEGSLVFYSAPHENVAAALAEAFEAEYGISTEFVRLSSEPLIERYSAEASAGAFAADVLFTGPEIASFLEQATGDGWVQPIEEAGIPVLDDGTYPEEFKRDGSVTLSVSPWLIPYNTNRVEEGDLPETWEDIADPRFRDQVLVAEVAPIYLPIWSLIYEEYGEEFFERLRDQNFRVGGSGTPIIQSLGAGEGDIAPPAIGSQVQGVADGGAPVDTVTPARTTGVEFQVVLTHPDKASNPNAARLFAHFVLSQEGNAIAADFAGTFSVYDTDALPAEYTQPVATLDVARLEELLGL